MNLGVFLASKKGKRFYNFAYCWGACLVITGAIFKITSLPYDDLMLMIGLFTEVFIFFISGFETPAEEFKWNLVFPELEEGAKVTQPESLLNDKVHSLKMERMNANIDKLNKMYEMQIDSLEKQISTIQKMNSSLDRITAMYNNAASNSGDIPLETEKISKQLSSINQYYGRVLNAINVKVEK